MATALLHEAQAQNVAGSDAQLGIAAAARPVAPDDALRTFPHASAHRFSAGYLPAVGTATYAGPMRPWGTSRHATCTPLRPQPLRMQGRARAGRSWSGTVRRIGLTSLAGTALSLSTAGGRASVGFGSAVAESRMLKGPYVQNLAPTSISVMWQAEPQRAATVEVTGPFVEAGPSETRSYPAAKARVVQAEITNLLPGTRYRYVVRAGDESWSGEFRTAPPLGSNAPFSFVVFGDSRQNAEAHRRVIERISQDVPDFLLGTGDMVDDGAKQEQWQQFFDVERVLLRDNVYFPALGNHDRQGRGRTADSYREYFDVPDNGTDSERYYAYTYANSRFLVLDSNAHNFSLTDQTAWLERELAAARQDPAIRHIFVVMHHPPFSTSLHAGQRDLRERWTPLFETYAVTAVFSGHDHLYQRAEHNGIRYFVSGGGGAPLYPVRGPRASAIDLAAVKRAERIYHHLRVTITGDQVEVAAVRVDGTLLENMSWRDSGAAPAMLAQAKEGPATSVTAAPIGAPSANLATPPQSVGAAGAAAVMAPATTTPQLGAPQASANAHQSSRSWMVVALAVLAAMGGAVALTRKKSR